MASLEDFLVSRGGSKQILFGTRHGVPAFQDLRANPATIRDEIIGWSGIGYKAVAKVGVQRIPNPSQQAIDQVGNRLLSIWAGDRMEYALGVTVRTAI